MLNKELKGVDNVQTSNDHQSIEESGMTSCIVMFEAAFEVGSSQGPRDTLRPN